MISTCYLERTSILLRLAKKGDQTGQEYKPFASCLCRYIGFRPTSMSSYTYTFQSEFSLCEFLGHFFNFLLFQIFAIYPRLQILHCPSGSRILIPLINLLEDLQAYPSCYARNRGGRGSAKRERERDSGERGAWGGGFGHGMTLSKS